MKTNKTYKFILSGGGTGGHIYPAIAIANELKSRYPSAQFLFVGAQDKMEMEKVPQAGYNIKGLWIAGIQRKITFKNALFPFKLLSSLLKARKILKQFKPDVAIGTGGFASGPLLYMATRKGVPSLIQEQNSFPGITNKLLAKRVNKICVAYDNLERFFPKDKIIKTGNPVRGDLLKVSANVSQARETLELDSKKFTVLILGGSLGAKRINELVANELDFFETHNVQIIWQCGKLYYEAYKIYNDIKYVQVHAFINNMEVAYAAADLVISRAGASSVSELCIVGKPVVFIPSPNVAEDHQTKNANALAKENAAVLIRESELEADFESKVKLLIASKEKRDELSANIKKFALVNATTEIVNQIELLLKK